jgi:16S rRNA (cytidine1402-2'-O)-methyltransferase
MSKLFVIATPIGNLEDVTLRAVRVLSEVEVVFCEDTRVTRKLLDRYEISTRVETLHQHSEDRQLERVWGWLQQGDVAYVTDAGTPGVSDPGGRLVEYVLGKNWEIGDKKLEVVNQVVEDGREMTGSGIQGNDKNLVQIVPVPGASALTAALSVAGIALDRFVFLGFPPVKNKRQKYFDEVMNFEMTVVFYESTYRLRKSLEEIEKRDSDRLVIVLGELTKMHEKVFRGKVSEVLQILNAEREKGEFVVIVEKDRSERLRANEYHEEHGISMEAKV